MRSISGVHLGESPETAIPCRRHIFCLAATRTIVPLVSWLSTISGGRRPRRAVFVWAGLSFFARGLARVGARVFGVDAVPESMLPPHARESLSGYLQVTSLFDEQAAFDAVRRWARSMTFDRVETLWQPAVLLVARLREALGAPGLSSRVRSTRPGGIASTTSRSSSTARSSRSTRSRSTAGSCTRAFPGTAPPAHRPERGVDQPSEGRRWRSRRSGCPF